MKNKDKILSSVMVTIGIIGLSFLGIVSDAFIKLMGIPIHILIICIFVLFIIGGYILKK